VNLVPVIQDLLSQTGVPIFSAFLLGLLVSFSPCPLTTNLTALAYIGKRASDPGMVLVSGLMYTAGRMASYTIIVALLVLAGLEASGISWLLQDIGEYLLGPALVLAGLVILKVIPLRLPAFVGLRVDLGTRLAEAGPLGALGIGALFALAFCPYSAAIFFGALLPLVLEGSGGIGLAPAFAIGTGLPVLLAAVLMSLGVSQMVRWFGVANRVEPALRWLVGLVFIGAGLYLVMNWMASAGLLWIS